MNTNLVMALLELCENLERTYCGNSSSRNRNQDWNDQPNYGYGREFPPCYSQSVLQNIQQIPFASGYSPYSSGMYTDSYTNNFNASNYQFYQNVQEFPQCGEELERIEDNQRIAGIQEPEDELEAKGQISFSSEVGTESYTIIKDDSSHFPCRDEDLSENEEHEETLESLPENMDSVEIESIRMGKEQIDDDQSKSYPSKPHEEAKKDISFNSEVSIEPNLNFEFYFSPLPVRLEEFQKEAKGEEWFELYPLSTDSIQIKNMRMGKFAKLNDYQQRPYPEEPRVVKPHVLHEDNNFVT